MGSESGGRRGSGAFQNLSSGKGRNLQEGQDQFPGLEHGSKARDDQASSSTGDKSKIVDGDPDIPPKEVVKLSSIPYVGQLGASKWSSCFGVKPLGKSSFPPIKTIPNSGKGSCAIAIPDKIVDHNI